METFDRFKPKNIFNKICEFSKTYYKGISKHPGPFLSGGVCALLGARSAVIDDLVTFTTEIESSLANEQGSLNELLDAMGYSRDEMLAGSEPSPTCLGFTGFIKNACATRAWHDGFVSLLECP